MRKVDTAISILYILIVIVFLYCTVIPTFAYAASEAEKMQNIMNPFKNKLPVKKKADPQPAPSTTRKPSTQKGTGASPATNNATKIPTPAPGPANGNTNTVVAPVPIKVLPPLPDLPELTITGLIWNSEKPQAIINGEIKGINDSVSFLKVTNIDKEGVKLRAVDGRLMSIKSGTTGSDEEHK